MRIVNVSITACSSGCILHRSGHLWVENCYLRCIPRGLDHLFSALVTVASDFGKHMVSRMPLVHMQVMS